jgi:hypothetical protein
MELLQLLRLLRSAAAPEVAAVDFESRGGWVVVGTVVVEGWQSW